MIARRRAATQHTAPASTAAAAGGDLLSLLLTAQDPDTGDVLDERDQALVFLLAGHETTGAALAFALHLLGRHPEVQQRVRDEVQRVAAHRPIGAGDIEHLSCTSQVIEETIRLIRPVTRSFAGRVRKASCAVTVGYRRRGSWPSACGGDTPQPLGVARPYRFDPDRFSPRREAPEKDGAEGTTHPSRYAHLPFGGGPRGCIGQYLAMAEMIVAIATIVRSFADAILAEHER